MNLDGFTFYQHAESAGLWCDRCPFESLVQDVQGSTLQDLIDDATKHDAEVHS